MAFSLRAAACTVLLYADARGLPFVVPTLEFVGNVPNRLMYYSAGTSFESVTPDGHLGIIFDSKHVIFVVEAYVLLPVAKQDTLLEAANDQWLNFTTNSLDGNNSPDVAGVAADKILSGLYLGMWVLGNFCDGGRGGHRHEEAE